MVKDADLQRELARASEVVKKLPDWMKNIQKQRDEDASLKNATRVEASVTKAEQIVPEKCDK